MRVYRFMTGPIQVNTYLAFDETKKGFIVDPGGYSAHLIETVKQEGIEIEYIILTHGHADHIGGVAEFLEVYPDAKATLKKLRYVCKRSLVGIIRRLTVT